MDPAPEPGKLSSSNIILPTGRCECLRRIRNQAGHWLARVPARVKRQDQITELPVPDHRWLSDAGSIPAGSTTYQ